MPVGANDDTVASSLPSTADAPGELSELVAGRYRIVRWLGGGGMGRVYEARDTELDERVALKVLRANLSEEAVERFRREVRLTRRIQHRNVARMFDIGDHHGDKFLTMELVDGEPLTRALGAAMPWPRLQQLALQICEGLAAAHACGVVHRDLKPDNVLVEHRTDRAVITDFGIARSTDDASVTQAGTLIGTPRYMAPEQLAGTEVDARADLFSLGVMLYELASGARPWSGDNAIAIAVAQATQPPRPLAAPQAPRALAGVLETCLALERDHRPATARALADELAAIQADDREPAARRPTPTAASAVAPAPTPTPIASGATLAETSSIAVLAFRSAPDDAHLADGVREDLIDTLSTTPSLRVRPAGRLDAAIDPRDAGRALAVDHVVVGAVQRAGAGLRISARLISVADGFQIWARRVDCSDADVLAVSEQLGRALAGALSTRATPAERPTDPRAVELYLRARAELRRFWGDHARTAMTLLEEAAALSPSPSIVSALAFATVQAWTRADDPALLPRVRAAIDRALPTGTGEAYLASAVLRSNLGDLEGGAIDLGTALRRAPTLALAHELAGWLLVETGAIAEGRRHLENALELDPSRTHAIHADLVRVDALQGDWAAVTRRIDRIRADPDPSVSQLGSVIEIRMASWRRDLDAMIAHAGHAGERFGPQNALVIEAVQSWRAGRPFDAATFHRVLPRRLEDGRARRYQMIVLQRACEVAALVEEREHALAALQLTAELGTIDLTWLDACPLFASLHDDPRWGAVRATISANAARVLAAFRAAAA